MAAYVRTVRTGSGARAVQIVHSSRRGARDIEHVGSACDDAEWELLKAVARQRLAVGQGEFDLGLGINFGSGVDSVVGAGSSPVVLPITGSRMGHLWDSLSAAYDALLFDAAADDEVFRQLVLARIIEPTSKRDSARVLEEVGVKPASYATVNRRLPVYAKDDFRERLAAVCAAHVGLGPATLVLYDVSTLYFETDTGDGFRESGYSKERRLEPQVTIGLLTAAHGFPLMVHAFEGNKAETTTMLPVLRAFMAAHRLTDVTVVADTGMVSETNKKAIEDAGLSFILGAKMPFVPFVVDEWRRKHPDENIVDGQIFTQPWPAGPKDKRRDHTFYYQYKADRARRTLHGLEQQVEKARKALAGKAAIKRNRFVKLTGGERSLDQELIDKTVALAGLKGYVTNLPPETSDAAFVINAYHHLFHVEKSFRMSKHDLQARPIYHRKQDSIDAHLTIVFAALAVSHWIENATGWSIKKFVQTARRYRTIRIQTGEHTIAAADPVPADLRQAIADIQQAAAGAH